MRKRNVDTVNDLVAEYHFVHLTNGQPRRTIKSGNSSVVSLVRGEVGQYYHQYRNPDGLVLLVPVEGK